MSDLPLAKVKGVFTARMTNAGGQQVMRAAEVPYALWDLSIIPSGGEVERALDGRADVGWHEFKQLVADFSSDVADPQKCTKYFRGLSRGRGVLTKEELAAAVQGRYDRFAESPDDMNTFDGITSDGGSLRSGTSPRLKHSTSTALSTQEAEAFWEAAHAESDAADVSAAEFVRALCPTAEDDEILHHVRAYYGNDVYAMRLPPRRRSSVAGSGLGRGRGSIRRSTSRSLSHSFSPKPRNSRNRSKSQEPGNKDDEEKPEEEKEEPEPEAEKEPEAEAEPEPEVTKQPSLLDFDTRFKSLSQVFSTDAEAEGDASPQPLDPEAAARREAEFNTMLATDPSFKRMMEGLAELHGLSEEEVRERQLAERAARRRERREREGREEGDEESEEDDDEPLLTKEELIAQHCAAVEAREALVRALMLQDATYRGLIAEVKAMQEALETAEYTVTNEEGEEVEASPEIAAEMRSKREAAIAAKFEEIAAREARIRALCAVDPAFKAKLAEILTLQAAVDRGVADDDEELGEAVEPEVDEAEVETAVALEQDQQLLELRARLEELEAVEGIDRDESAIDEALASIARREQEIAAEVRALIAQDEDDDVPDEDDDVPDEEEEELPEDEREERRAARIARRRQERRTMLYGEAFEEKMAARVEEERAVRAAEREEKKRQLLAERMEALEAAQCSVTERDSTLARLVVVDRDMGELCRELVALEDTEENAAAIEDLQLRIAEREATISRFMAEDEEYAALAEDIVRLHEEDAEANAEEIAEKQQQCRDRERVAAEEEQARRDRALAEEAEREAKEAEPEPEPEVKPKKEKGGCCIVQ